MAVNPHTVVSPQDRLSRPCVIHITQWWSLAIGIWDGDRALLVRWNGDPDHLMGNPVSHANPTWFMLPEDFHDLLLTLVLAPNQSNAKHWLAGGEPTAWVTPAWEEFPN
jgi:hypothetical protein